MMRLYFPAERPLDGRCPDCGATLTFVHLVELIDSALQAKPDNLRKSPRWICRACWGLAADASPAMTGSHAEPATRPVMPAGD